MKNKLPPFKVNYDRDHDILRLWFETPKDDEIISTFAEEIEDGYFLFKTDDKNEELVCVEIHYFKNKNLLDIFTILNETDPLETIRLLQEQKISMKWDEEGRNDRWIQKIVNQIKDGVQKCVDELDSMDYYYNFDNIDFLINSTTHILKYAINIINKEDLFKNDTEKTNIFIGTSMILIEALTNKILCTIASNGLSDKVKNAYLEDMVQKRMEFTERINSN